MTFRFQISLLISFLLLPIKGKPTYFSIWDDFSNALDTYYANFQRKISSDTNCRKSQTLAITLTKYEFQMTFRFFGGFESPIFIKVPVFYYLMTKIQITEFLPKVLNLLI